MSATFQCGPSRTSANAGCGSGCGCCELQDFASQVRHSAEYKRHCKLEGIRLGKHVDPELAEYISGPILRAQAMTLDNPSFRHWSLQACQPGGRMSMAVWTHPTSKLSSGDQFQRPSLCPFRFGLSASCLLNKVLVHCQGRHAVISCFSGVLGLELGLRELAPYHLGHVHWLTVVPVLFW